MMNTVKKMKSLYKIQDQVKRVGLGSMYHAVRKESNENGAKVVDMRSDTVTKPSKAMREAMFTAEVGDDIMMEDPTVKALESQVAAMTGKDAALFVASGTMGNLLSVLTHCSSRGSEVVLGSDCHIFYYEQGNIAQFGGVQTRTVQNNPDGTFNIDQIEIRSTAADFHAPTTELVCIENTHCKLGGRVLPLQWVDEMSAFCKKNNVPLHMDGARVFNASTALGLPVSRILQGVDSASICLSKGLGCPVGSVIVGSHHFIQRATQLRKGLGGAWRQAGLLAACGIYALDNNVQRLATDHANARRLAQGINELKSPNVYVNLEDVQSNMLLLCLNPKACSPDDFAERMISSTVDEEETLGERIKVKAFPMTATSVRLVAHLDVDASQIEAAIRKIQFLTKELDGVM